MNLPPQNDPMDFFRNMWSSMGFSLPGMVTPTTDTDELGKRIADLKSVEGWLKSNLSLLQMSIQGLEMQRNTLLAMQQMNQAAQQAGAGETAANPFLNPAAWPMPWHLMGDLAPPPAPSAAESAAAAPPPASAAGKKTKPKG